ncbi:MAG TPA: hypothetical protein VLL52_03875, partial [Anaerolineae bacterium]|nr:hypothetical protein [Anaerolineae bacterium]
LQTNVPGGNVYENLLTIYHSPDNGLSWQRLNTTLDTQENFAAAQMRGNGLYTLLSTIAYDPFTTGWNNFGYVIPETRPVTDSLASIANQYGSIHRYTSGATTSWPLYDPLLDKNHPSFAPLVNTLTTLDYNQGYWITVTQPITLFMTPPDDTPSSFTNPSHLQSLQLPPATYFGWITPTTSFTPTIGMPVTAWIDDTLCGSTNIIAWQGRLAYTVQVASEPLWGTPNNCGQAGKTVTFKVGEWVMTHDRPWANDHAWYHPLTDIFTCPSPSPISTFTITTNNEDINLAWTNNDADLYNIWHVINTPYFIPTTSCATSLNCTTTTATNHTQLNALNNASENYTFLIIAENSCGITSSYSQRRGNFQFTLTSGH